MIELKDNSLLFSFPEVHEDASMSINFQRTLRIPDDDTVHSLPPGLGNFPLKHVDDYAETIPEGWRQHGGVMLPMFQSEAMWLNFGNNFRGHKQYPCLIKVATGKINAVTGEPWQEGANRDPQDYMVRPAQPWLDGYCVKKGEIRQFVAMPLGAGYTAEEQITGEAEHGGLQVIVYPMKAKEWEKLQKQNRKFKRDHVMDTQIMYCMAPPEMGLAPGGRMKQEIYDDPYGLDVWDLRHGSRCFVHMANSLHWRAITGEAPPTIPPTAKQYSQAGLPWFDYYSDGSAVEGSGKLSKLKSVLGLSKENGEKALPENEPAQPEKIVVIKEGKVGVGGLGKDVVKEGEF